MVKIKNNKSKEKVLMNISEQYQDTMQTEMSNFQVLNQS